MRKVFTIFAQHLMKVYIHWPIIVPCILVLLFPLVAPLGLIVWHGIPDMLLDGDPALIGIATRSALTGDQLLGPYSRFGFNHPGPFYFYLLAPLYWLTDFHALSLHVTAICLNGAALIGMVIILRRVVNQWTCLWFLLLMAQYIRYLSPSIVMSIWNPCVTILPFLLAIFCCAAMMTGRVNYWPLAVIVFSFVTQTHLGYTPVLVVVVLCALLSAAIPTIGNALGCSSGSPQEWKRPLLASSVLLLLLWILPVIEQFSESPGNMTQIAQTFLTSSSTHSWQEIATAAQGIFTNYTMSFFGNGNPWKTFPPPQNLAGLTRLLVWIQGIALLLAYWLARRRQQHFLAGLALLCGLSMLLIVISLQGVVGPIHDYLVMWMTGIGFLTWFVLGAGVWQTWGNRLHHLFQGRVQWGLMVIFGILLGAITYNSTPAYLAEARMFINGKDSNTFTQGLRPVISTALDALHEQEMERCLLKLADRALWPALAGFALELTNAGITTTVDPRWPPGYSSRYRPDRLPETILVLCRPASCKNLQGRLSLEQLAAAPEFAVLQPSEAGLHGEFSFAALPEFALIFQNFSEAGSNSQGDTFRWSTADKSWLAVGLQKGVAHRMTLTAAIPPNIKSVECLFNGHTVAMLHAFQEWGWDTFPIQIPAALAQSMNELRFDYQYNSIPEQPRREGRDGSAVAFKSIAFEPMETD